MSEDLLRNTTVKCVYLAAVLVLVLVITMQVLKFGWFYENMSDWAAGVPKPMETPVGYGYVAAPMPYGGLGGPGIRFNVLTDTSQRPYSTGYLEKRWPNA